MPDAERASLLAQVLSSYLSNNTVAPAELPFVVETLKAALSASADSTPISDVKKANEYHPVVPVRDSVTPDALTCLCCGKQLKSLSRHLRVEHGLTADEYRANFDLKGDYPVVAPNYSMRRSDLAKSAHFGRKPKILKAVQRSLLRPRFKSFEGL